MKSPTFFMHKIIIYKFNLKLSKIDNFFKNKNAY